MTMKVDHTAPQAGWAPNYELDSGALLDFDRVIQGDGYKLICTWSKQHGYGAFIEHDQHDGYSIKQLQSLVDKLQGYIIECKR